MHVRSNSKSNIVSIYFWKDLKETTVRVDCFKPTFPRDTGKYSMNLKTEIVLFGHGNIFGRLLLIYVVHEEKKKNNTFSHVV